MLNLMCGTTIFYNAMIDNSFTYTKQTWTARCYLGTIGDCVSYKRSKNLNGDLKRLRSSSRNWRRRPNPGICPVLQAYYYRAAGRGDKMQHRGRYCVKHKYVNARLAVFPFSESWRLVLEVVLPQTINIPMQLARWQQELTGEYTARRGQYPRAFNCAYAPEVLHFSSFR